MLKTPVPLGHRNKERLETRGMANRKKTRVEQAIETRKALIEAGKSLFGSKGYHTTGTHEIVDEANVTRGALQHHFPRKEDLFLAVFNEVRLKWIEDATKGPHGTENRWIRFRENLRMFIRVAATPTVHRIVMIDGPAVLGWQEWRLLQASEGLNVVMDAIADGIQAGLIRDQPPRALAYLLIALIEEGALLVTYAENAEEAIDRTVVALDTLLSNMA